MTDLDDETLAVTIFREGKQVLAELKTDPTIVKVDDSELEALEHSRTTGMMRSLNFKVGFGRFKSAAPTEMDIQPIDEETEVEESEEDRLIRERKEEANRKLEKIKKDIRKKEIELLRVYELGKTRRREYRQTENAHKKEKNTIARSLWMMRKSHSGFLTGMKDYKNQMFKVSLPCHDTSNSVLANEAKILKTNHNCHMMDHQMKIMHEHQDPLISFLHKAVMKEAQKDKEEAVSKLKDEVFAYLKGKEELTEAYEDVMTAQRTLIGTLQLHDTEPEDDDNFSISDSAREDAAKLAAAAANGDFRDFKSTKLRRSAELRIEAKFGSLKERQAKKEIREEVFKKTLKNVEDMERTSMERAKNVSGEIESVLTSIQINMDKEELTEHPDEDEEDIPVPVEPSAAAAADGPSNVEEKKDESSSTAQQEALHASFVGEEVEEPSERGEDDHLESSHNDSAGHLSSTGDDQSESSRRRKQVAMAKKADVSARLEKLRKKRQQQQEQLATRMSNRKLGGSGSRQPSARRSELLERARSARSSRLVEGNNNTNTNMLSPRTKEAKLAELRERRRNRAASAIPPATVAEGS